MATIIISLVFCLSLFLSSVPAYAAVFNVASGDVTGLIAAINAANSNGQENTIDLEPGTYTLTAIDNGTFGNTNGLPAITSAMTITGAGRTGTTIERDANAPAFRILSVVAAGTLTLQGLTLSGGRSNFGGGISNGGMLTLIDCSLTGNSANSGGGGISNDGGTLALIGSILTRNGAMAGGGIDNFGTATITRTTFERNSVNVPGGGGLFNVGGGSIVTITDSTFVRNNSLGLGGGLLNNSGTLTLTNTTFALNNALAGGGGLLTRGSQNCETPPSPRIRLVQGLQIAAATPFKAIPKSRTVSSLATPRETPALVLLSMMAHRGRAVIRCWPAAQRLMRVTMRLARPPTNLTRRGLVLAISERSSSIRW